MAPISSYHMASDESYSTYLAVLKVHGDAIRLFDSSIIGTKSRGSNAYRIMCRDLESRTDKHGSNVQVFVLDKEATSTETSVFKDQQQAGEPVNSEDLALFISSPIDGSRKASYALDIGLDTTGSSADDNSFRKIGSAYIYLEPKFSTQGIQRMQIIGTQSKSPVGQIQVDYLIVTNPLGYKVKASRPQWLSPKAQLDAGHRGAGSGCRADLPGVITENTVASFNYAARHGADMCELDVMCTADGVPIVYHNYTLNTSKPDAVQIDQLTLEQLRGLKGHSIHEENCKHNKENISDSETNQMFPTLEQVLKDVDKSCALNVELKWAQMLPNGRSEATHYREINDYVDRVLDCINKHSDGRHILFSSLNPDVAIILRLKQTHYPVLFLTTGDSQRFNDPTTKSVKSAIHFAQALDLAGINPNAAYLNEYLVRYAKERGLLVYAWGKIESPQTVKELRRYGLNGVIYDKIDLIKPQD